MAVLILLLTLSVLQDIPDSLALLAHALDEDALERIAERNPPAWTLSMEKSSLGWSEQVRLQSRWSALRIAMIVDHDAAEPRWADHVLGFVEATPRQDLRLILGYFKVAAGSGLVAGSTGFGGPIDRGSPPVRTPETRPYAGSSVQRVLRGMAGTWQVGPLAWIVWVSRQQLDGEVLPDGVRILDDGIHRSDLERARRGAVPSHSFGTAASLGRGRSSAGLVLSREYLGPFQEEALEAFGKAGIGFLRVSSAVGWCSCRTGPPSGWFSVTIRPASRSPSTEIYLRSLARGGRLSFPSTTVSVSDHREQAATLLTGIPVPGGRLTIGLDRVHTGATRRTRSRLILNTKGLSLSADRSLGYERTHAQLGMRTVYTPSPEARHTVRSRIRWPASGAWALELWWAEKQGLASTAARITMSKTYNRLDLTAGIIQFHRPEGAPVLSVYEPQSAHIFPLAVLSGTGRRMFLRVRFRTDDLTLMSFLAMESRLPEGPVGRAHRTLEVSFSLSRR